MTDKASRDEQNILEELRRNNRKLANLIEDNSRLQVERLYLASIVDSCSDAIIGQSLDGRVTSWNRAAERMFGYRAAEIIGQPLTLLFPPDRLKEEAEILARIVAGQVVTHYETMRMRKDGSAVSVSLTASPILGAEGQVTGASQILHDITEQRRIQEEHSSLQAELVHLSRWNMMGMMAASLAHELNQPLTAILNYIRAARRLIADNPATAKPAEFLDKAVAETKLASEIIRSLRAFIEKREATRKPENLNAVLQDGLSLSISIRSEAKARIALRLAEQLPPVLIDRVQIQQVLLNLVRNALEAMKDMREGQLTVETAQGPEGFVSVSVSDTGPGLAPEISNQLFQPFVTTKDKSMGVGLSISRSLVEAHGGRIWTEPNQPRGTVFRFRLPIMPAEGDDEP